MTREVDLASYLPPFLAKFKEITAALEAENPEFKLLWRATDRVLRNEFIATADEYGIERFEEIMKIMPDKGADLETRRFKLLILWNAGTPFTKSELYKKLVSICGSEDEFELVEKYQEYQIEIYTHLGAIGAFEMVLSVLKEMLPCNILAIYLNTVPIKSPARYYFGGVACITEKIRA